ncbi:MAG TPA: retron St85 family effector protein [Anaerolineales bacterium]|nr:retron St85 family effector protein [Anaerolineales bacterium]
MSHQFEHPAGVVLLEEIRSLFRTKAIFRVTARPIVFVCGGPVQGEPKTLRNQFLQWLRSELPDLLVVLAEDAFKYTYLHDPPETVNLSTFETIIAEVSDCVIIFLESCGSFAEIGYFSGTRDVSRKILVVNDPKYQATDSFANLGPISTIDRKSFLSPTIHIDPTAAVPDFSPVKQRLSRILERPHRKRFKWAPYVQLEQKDKFLVSLQMVSILRLVSFDGLRHSIKAVFDGSSPKELKRLVSVLLAAGYLRPKNDYFELVPGRAALLQFDDTDLNSLTARVLYYYQRHQREVFRSISA